MARKVIDLREFIRVLESTGRLSRITREVDWKFELGQITRENQVPLLFEYIKNYPGHRVFTNGFSSLTCIAAALGLHPDTNRKALISALKARVTRPIAPVVVADSSVFENVMRNDEVDFLRLPIPQWSEQEKGRYLGTWHINVTKDPETGIRNVGVYRMQVLGRKQATVSTSPSSHLAQQFAKAEKKGNPLAMAVAIGVPESVIMAAAAAYPAGCDEFELAGALQARALDLVQCQTVQLEAPAASEIVIEGQLMTGVRAQDGPYFDYTGRTDINPNAFLFEARQIMFRNAPIFRGAAIGVPGAEDHQLFSILSELHLADFHGWRIKQSIQNQLLRTRRFRALQWSARVGSMMPKLR